MLNHTLIFQALALDLVERSTLSPDIIKGLIRWFSPLGDSYVKRVTEWQELLVAGTGGSDVGPLLVRARCARPYGPHYALCGNVFDIAAIHQIALIFWKEEVEVPGDWDAYAQRLATSGSPNLSHPIIGKLAEWTHHLLGEAPSWDEMIGKLGSGATADRRNAQTRWYFNRPPLGVPPAFYAYNDRDIAPYHSTDVVLTARAAMVPKNRKSPRFVASEPAAAMYAQLACMNALDSKLQAIRKQVPIRNAERHREFLRRHAMTLATLDLSDASDYISMDLANYILPTSWADRLNSCRSQGLRLPDGRYIRLATYAPMGNGFCFRLLSIVCAGLLDICSSGQWSDFGDDMICQSRDVPYVSMGLEAAGLVLNRAKSGIFGHFVESCGLDLYLGRDITPLKLKRVLSFNDAYADLVAAARAAQLGLYHVGSILAKGVGKLPSRYNRSLQRCEYRCPVWTTIKHDVSMDGYPGMTRWHATRGENYSNNVTTLSRTRPGYKWLPDFVVGAALRGSILDPTLTSASECTLAECDV